MGGNSKSDNQESTQDMSQQAFDMGAPAMQAAMKMFQETINTGGVQARQPIYSQAAEKSLQAGNQAKIAMAEDNARTGLAGTPFAEAMMKQLDLTSRQNAVAAPMAMENADYWKVLSTFFPGAGDSMGQGIESMTALTGYDTQLVAGLQTLIGSMFDTTMGGIQSMAKG